MKQELETPRPSFGRRVSLRITGATEHVDRFKTPLGIAVLAFAAFLAFTAFKATTGPPFLPKYRLTVKVPSDAPPLRRGEAVRVGGSLAGLIASVDPDPVHDLTLVKVNITKGGFKPLPVDSTAFVRVHSIVYMTYLALTPGSSKKMLQDGDTLPALASSGTDLLKVVELFDEQARNNLSKTLVNVGFGAAGRGAALNGALQDLPETATYGAAELRALTKTPGALEKLISSGADTASALRGSNPGDVSGLIDGGASAFSAIAARRDALGRAIGLLPSFENQVLATGPIADPVLADIGATSAALSPAVRSLNRDLPALNRLAALGPQLREGFTALLGGGASGSAGGGGGGGVGTGTGATGIANQVLVAARPVVSKLFGVQTALGPLNDSLNVLLAAVKPYQQEITQAGQWLGSALSTRVDAGKRKGAPTLRLTAVLTPHACHNPEPAPGQAQKDAAKAGGC